MKKLVLTAVASLACLAAFAQGRISFQTDSLHLVYYDPSGPLGGTAVSAANLPTSLVGSNLVADLYMGTSSSSLTLYTSTTFGATAGKWNTVNYSSPFAGGSVVFVVAQIRDQGFAAPTTWAPGQVAPFGTFYGVSQEFQFTLGTSTLAYPPMYAPGASLGGGFSTWAAGTYPLDSVSAGFKGAIMVSPVPEPTSIALAGLGAAALLIFRRRK